MELNDADVLKALKILFDRAARHEDRSPISDIYFRASRCIDARLAALATPAPASSATGSWTAQYKVGQAVECRASHNFDWEKDQVVRIGIDYEQRPYIKTEDGRTMVSHSDIRPIPSPPPAPAPSPLADQKPEARGDAVDVFLNREPTIFLFSPTLEQAKFVDEFTLAKRAWQAGGYKSKVEWEKEKGRVFDGDIHAAYGTILQLREQLQKSETRILNNMSTKEIDLQRELTTTQEALTGAREQWLDLSKQLTEEKAKRVEVEGQLENGPVNHWLLEAAKVAHEVMGKVSGQIPSNLSHAWSMLGAAIRNAETKATSAGGGEGKAEVMEWPDFADNYEYKITLHRRGEVEMHYFFGELPARSGAADTTTAKDFQMYIKADAVGVREGVNRRLLKAAGQFLSRFEQYKLNGRDQIAFGHLEAAIQESQKCPAMDFQLYRQLRTRVEAWMQPLKSQFPPENIPLDTKRVIDALARLDAVEGGG